MLQLSDFTNLSVLRFGGDVQSFNSQRRDYVCLHSLTNLSAQRASMNVIQDISWTTIENAMVLIEQGDAKKEDFWVFCGYAGWGPDQLKGELERKSWHMASADSQLLLKEVRA